MPTTQTSSKPYAESRRSSESFVDLNCAGLPRDLLESELFGHEKGAFTGAVGAKAGLIEPKEVNEPRPTANHQARKTHSAPHTT